MKLTHSPNLYPLLASKSITDRACVLDGVRERLIYAIYNIEKVFRELEYVYNLASTA